MRTTATAILWLSLAALSCGEARATEKIIPGVPNYDQDVFPIDHAYGETEGGDCTPVACTMLQGYYDGNEWPRLIPYGSNSASQNAWGIDTVIRKYKTQLGYVPTVGTRVFTFWNWIIGNKQGDAIVAVIHYFDPNSKFSREDDDSTYWSRIQSYINNKWPCVLSVAERGAYSDTLQNTYKWEGSTVMAGIYDEKREAANHTVCALGWSDVGGRWVICNMGWLYSSHAWFNYDTFDDWYISQITPGGFSSGEDDDAYEDNDKIDNAKAISFVTLNNLRCVDTLILTGDYKWSYGDWFKVSAPAGQVLSVSVSFTHANGNLDLRIYDPSKSEVDSSTGTGNSETVNVTSTSSGYYFIFVYGVGNAKNQNYSLTVKLEQTCTYTLTPTSGNYGSGAGAGSFSVTAPSGCSWSASPDDSWIHTSSSGSGNGTVNYTIEANSSANMRSGTIIVQGQVFTVNQERPEQCAYSLSPTSASHGSAAGAGSFSVAAQAGCGWSASASVSWIHTSSSGIGSGTVNYSVDANSSANARSGTITVQGQTFTVNQDGPCTYALSPTSANHGSGAENGSFTVTAKAGCPWSATSGASWIHTTSTGNGSGTVNYTVDANPGAARSGTIAVQGQVFTINQGCGNCITSIDIGDATETPGATTQAGGGYDIEAGGSDIWNTDDGFRFVYEQRAGDFDAKARVASIELSAWYAKAGLMARESTSGNCRYFSVYTTPTMGANDYRAEQRVDIGGWSSTVGSSNWFIHPAPYPNAWVRIKRQGSVFSAYRSANGVNWVLMAQAVLNLPNTLLVGMATTSHNSGTLTTASYRDYSCSGATPTTLSVFTENDVIMESGGTSGKIHFVASGNGPLPVSYSLSGSASNGTDYSSVASTITIPAGTNAVVLNVVPRNDASSEGGETVILTPAASASYSLVAPYEGQIKILDDENPMGGLKREVYLDLLGESVADLESSVSYPDSPSFTDYVGQFESVLDLEYYGERLSGYLVPPATGSYVFYLTSDDASEVWLSTDEKPANKRLIVEEAGWNAYRNYEGEFGANPPLHWDTGTPMLQRKSASISLQANTVYYIEALHKEGSVNDHLSLAWKTPNGSIPTNGQAPIPGQYLAYSLPLPSTNPPITIVTTSPLPNGIKDSSYNVSLQATNGTSPYVWAIVSGSLPPGLTLSGNSIVGTPTSVGTYSVQLSVRDSQARSTNRSFAITIFNKAPTILSTSPLPTATQGVPYSYSIPCTNGNPPFTWSRSSGTLPAGLQISSNIISGTPTSFGTNTFSVTVVDSKGFSTNKTFVLVVSPPIYYIWADAMPLNAGSITMNPSPGPDSSYAAGTQVQLSIRTNAGYGFSHWSGDLPTGVVSNRLPLTVVADQDREIVANFLIMPRVILQPRSQTNTAGATVTFNITVEGSSPITFQWLFNGLLIATSQNLVLNNIQATNAGEYWVIVSNKVGVAISSRANLVICSPPVIARQPQDVTVTSLPGVAQFSVQATGLDMRYQWLKEGQSITESAKFNGTQTSMLTINNVTIEDTGAERYSVRISNGGGVVESRRASLSIECPNHPGDLDRDWRITMAEMIAYAKLWKSNQAPMDHMIRAAYLWKNGEQYVCDPSKPPPACWVPLNANPGSGNSLELASIHAASTGSAVCEMPELCNPGVPFELSIQVAPEPSVSAFGLEEAIPTGWTVSEINENGVWDGSSGKIKWGPFFGNNPVLLTYKVNPPVSAAGEFAFSGKANFDGINEVPVTGQRTTTVRMGGSTVVCSMPTNYVPGQPITVAITVTPATNVSVFGVEDRPPAQWNISNISSGGSFDAASGKVKWGPYFEITPIVLSYQATPPAEAVGQASFQGSANFDGTEEQPIGGIRECASIELGQDAILTLYMFSGMVINGQAGRTYIIQYSEDLASPMNWTNAEEVVLTSANQVWIDLQSTNKTMRYYRALIKP